MKRQQDRDASPKNKRSRGQYIDHEDRDRDYVSDIRRGDGRARGGSGGGRLRNNIGMGGRDMLPKREPIIRDRNRDMRPRDFIDYESRPQRRMRDIDRGGDDFRDLDLDLLDHTRPGRLSQEEHRELRLQMQAVPDYRTLCVSNLNLHVADDEIKKALLRAFERYGEFNVRVVHTGDNFRIAYVNFRYPEDARRAKLASQDLILFDKLARIDAVYQQHTKSNQPQQRPRSISPERRGGHMGGNENYGGGRRMSPPPNRMGRRDDMHDMPGRVQGGYDRGQPRGGGDREHREHKFPFYLHHIDPEDDEKATRTLFVGSLDRDIGETELKQVFQRYGYVEDIDIKRPSPGQGNPYAFIRFLNLDMAHAAKVDMSGEYIGGMQCKIGYGKANPSPCLWIGGLGPYILPEELEREFDRFGLIKKFEWLQGRNYAYVLYDSVEGAKAACHEMRGFPIAGPNRRLRIDYADENHMSDRYLQFAKEAHNIGSSFGDAGKGAARGGQDQWEQRGPNRRGMEGKGNDWGGPGRNQRHQDGPREQGFNDGPRRRDDRFNSGGDRRRPPRNFDNDRGYRTREQRESPHNNRDQDRNQGSHSPPYRRGRNQSFRDDHGARDDQLGPERTRQPEESQLPMGNVQQASTIGDLAKCLPVVWRGALVLKNSSFLTKMHLVSGDVHLVDTLMRDPSTTETPCLRITQRLRLDQPKLDEMIRRVCSNTQSGHSVLLAMPGSSQTSDDPNTEVQQRPLKNLVTYFKQKESAGVISLPPYQDKDRNNVGVLHAFPPCQFSQEFLTMRASSLTADATSKEEYLVIVVVRGPALNI